MQKCKKRRDKKLGCAAQERHDDTQPASGMRGGGKDLAVKKRKTEVLEGDTKKKSWKNKKHAKLRRREGKGMQEESGSVARLGRTTMGNSPGLVFFGMI